MDQDIAKALPPAAPLTTEWRADLLGGVMVIKSQFADGSPMIAVPNYARMNREPADAPREGARERRPTSSVVWIKEA